MDKVERKELKSDHFALEVEHGVEFVGGHKKQFIQWGAIALAVILVVAGISWYRSYTHDQRAAALADALKIQNATVGPKQNEYMLAYATEGERTAAAQKAFTEVAAKYSGTDEGNIAEFYLAAAAGDKGDLAQAEKRFKTVVDSASKPYSSLAKMSLAQIYQGEGKQADAEKLVRSVMDDPTILVSKEQATIALAHLLASTNPQEARKLLEPLRASTRSAVSRAALSALGDLPQK